MARIPYFDESDLSAEDRELLAGYQDLDEEMVPHVDEPSEAYLAFRESGTSNLYGVLAYAPPILAAFRRLASAIRGNVGVDPATRELVVLVVARQLGGEYIWNHHVRTAFEHGVTPEQIVDAGAERYGAFDAETEVLLGYAHRYATDSVDEATFEAALEAHSIPTLVGVSMMASSYIGLYHLQSAFDIDIGEAFVGWELEGLAELPHLPPGIG